jgi:methyl-accepting chemotaxis protein
MARAFETDSGEGSMNGIRQWSLRARLIAMMGLMALLVCILGALSLQEEHSTLLQERHDKVRNQVESAVSLVETFENQSASGALPEAQARRLALEALTRMRYDGKEYFFVLDSGLRYLAHGAKATLVGKDLHALKDATGINMGELYDQALRTGDGKGFASFVWDKPGSDTPQPKLAYLMTSKGWHWVVVTGIYVDDLDATFHAKMLRLGLVSLLALLVLGAAGLMLLASVRRLLGAEPERLVEVVRHIADSRLDRPIELGRDDRHSVLAAVSAMHTQLRSLVQEIVHGADQLTGMNEQLAHNAADVASRSDQQSQGASAMAAAAEQLTASVTHIADNAQQARTLSQESGHLSADGGLVITQAMEELQRIHGVVEQAAEAIGTLTGKTQSIATIMQVIKEIADQTNLLALNAAIEAARAGETGRGFAVVADEVRKLSERTAHATDEIAGMIDEIHSSSNASQNRMDEAVQRVRTGLALAGQGSEAIGRIRDSNDRVIAVVSEISAALNEQAQASQDIAQQVEGIAQASALNAESSGQVAHSVHDMRGMAEKQRGLVSRFVL